MSNNYGYRVESIEYSGQTCLVSYLDSTTNETTILGPETIPFEYFPADGTPQGKVFIYFSGTDQTFVLNITGPNPSPTPTNTPTPTQNFTPTPTITITPTTTPTSTITPTPTKTPTVTPTSSITPTPSPTQDYQGCEYYQLGNDSTTGSIIYSYIDCNGVLISNNVLPPNPDVVLCAKKGSIQRTSGVNSLVVYDLGMCPSPTPTPTSTNTPTPSVTTTSTVTPTTTPSVTPTNTITPTVTPSVTPTNTPSVTPSVTPTESVTPTTTPTVTPTLTQTPTPTDLSAITTYTISGCSSSNVIVADLGPGAFFPGDTFYLDFTGATATECYTIINKINATPTDGGNPISSYPNCADCIDGTTTTYTISGCTTLNVLVADLGPGAFGAGDIFNMTFTGATPSGCYRIVNKIVATPTDTGAPLTFYFNCDDCEASLVTPTPTPTPTSSVTPTNTPTVTPTNTITPTPSTTPNAPVTSNLVLYYDPSNSSSYSGSGTTINDLSGNGLNGSMSGITYTSPYFSYNGTSSQVLVADNPLLEPGSGDWTMEVWVNQSVLGNDVVLGKFDNGGLTVDVSYSIRTTNTTYYAQLGSGSGSGSSLFVNSTNYVGTIDTWYQIVYVFTNVASNTLQTFVNGVSIGSVGHSLASILNTDNPLYIGSYNGGEYAQWFDGKIGITRLYNAALTSSQVLQNFNADKSKYGL
jgi:hypothetical protein